MYAFEFKICASGVMKAAVQSPGFCSFCIFLVKCGIDLGWRFSFFKHSIKCLCETYVQIYVHQHIAIFLLQIYIFLLKQYKLCIGGENITPYKCKEATEFTLFPLNLSSQQQPLITLRHILRFCVFFSSPLCRGHKRCK